MKAKRLAFAKKYEHWGEEQWMNVMFSDESLFRCVISSSGKVRRPRGSNCYDEKYTDKTVKHPDQVMIWGSFSGK